jgi:hypothetical protein
LRDAKTLLSVIAANWLYVDVLPHAPLVMGCISSVYELEPHKPLYRMHAKTFVVKVAELTAAWIGTAARLKPKNERSGSRLYWASV